MAQVPTLTVPPVENRPLPTEYYSPNTRGVNTGFGDGLVAVGQGLGQLGNDVTRIAMQQRQQDVERGAKDQDNILATKFRNISYGDGTDQNPGYYGLSGDNASKAYQPTVEALTKARQEMLDGIQDPAVKQIFGDWSQQRLARELEGAARFNLQQRNAAYEVTSAARVANFTTDAVNGWQDPALRERSTQGIHGEAEDLAHHKGWSPEQTKAWFDAHIEDLNNKVAAKAVDFLMGVPAPERGKMLGLSAGSASSSGFTPDNLHKVEGDGVNPHSGASGPIQITQATRDQYAPGKNASPQTDLEVFKGKSAADADALAGVLGRSPTDAERYVAWQQGTAGGPALFAHPDAKAIDVLTPAYNGNRGVAREAIVNNGGNVDMTAAQFTAHIQGQWTSKNAAGTAEPAKPAALDPMFSAIPADKLEQIKRQTAGEIRSDEATARAERERALAGVQAQLGQKIKDDVLSLTETGKPSAGTVPTAADMLAAGFTPHEASSYSRSLTRAQDSYAVRQNTVWANGAEEQQALTAAQPSGEGYAEQAYQRDLLTQALEAKHQMLATDPAKYVLQHSPELQQAFAESFKDPKKLAPAVAMLDRLYDRMDVPENQRSVLPVDTAKAFVNNLVSQPPEERGNTMVTLANQYGDLWPRVLGGMEKDGNLPGAYALVTAIGDPASRTMYMDYLTDPKAAKDALSGSAGPGEPAIATQIDQLIAGNPDLEMLSHSLSWASGGSAKFSEVKGVVSGIAYRYATIMPPEQAVKTAVAALTTDKYEFTDSGARVPKGQLGAVDQAAQATMATLKPDDLAPVANSGINPTMSKGDLQGLALRNAQRGGWVTNERDDGIFLMGGDLRPVTLANGKRLELKFNNLPTDVPSGMSQRPELTPIPGVFAKGDNFGSSITENDIKQALGADILHGSGFDSLETAKLDPEDFAHVKLLANRSAIIGLGVEPRNMTIDPNLTAGSFGGTEQGEYRQDADAITINGENRRAGKNGSNKDFVSFNPVVAAHEFAHRGMKMMLDQFSGDTSGLSKRELEAVDDLKFVMKDPKKEEAYVREIQHKAAGTDWTEHEKKNYGQDLDGRHTADILASIEFLASQAVAKRKPGGPR